MDLGAIFAFQFFNGIVWGLIFALIALGLSLTFGLMQLMNVAHGALYMLGAIFTASLIDRFKFGFWESVLASTLLVGALGALINETILKRVADAAPAIGLLATAGLLLVIDSSTLATFGSVPVAVDDPVMASIPMIGIDYPVYRLIVAGIAVLAIVGAFLFIRLTKFGLWMRAVPLQRELALISGISPNAVNRVTVVSGQSARGPGRRLDYTDCRRAFSNG